MCLPMPPTWPETSLQLFIKQVAASEFKVRLNNRIAPKWPLPSNKTEKRQVSRCSQQYPVFRRGQRLSLEVPDATREERMKKQRQRNQTGKLFVL